MSFPDSLWISAVVEALPSSVQSVLLGEPAALVGVAELVAQLELAERLEPVVADTAFAAVAVGVEPEIVLGLELQVSEVVLLAYKQLPAYSSISHLYLNGYVSGAA